MRDFEFFLDFLYPLPLVKKRFFGTTSYYLGDKIICATCTNDKFPDDKGIWVSTLPEFHAFLFPKLINQRFLTRVPTKKWILLPEDSDTFEEDARTVAELIKTGSEWIGTVPKPKKKKMK